jgi:hypothetical protein
VVQLGSQIFYVFFSSKFADKASMGKNFPTSDVISVVWRYLAANYQMKNLTVSFQHHGLTRKQQNSL